MKNIVGRQLEKALQKLGLPFNNHVRSRRGKTAGIPVVYSTCRRYRITLQQLRQAMQ